MDSGISVMVFLNPSTLNISGLITRNVGANVGAIKKHSPEKTRKCLMIRSPLTGSNRRPTDYKSVALPAELRRLLLFCRCKFKSLM